jgi:hypothetical protein
MEKLEPVDWFCKNSRHAKWNLNDNRLEVPHDSKRCRMDLRIVGIWYFGSSSTNLDPTLTT